MSLRSKLSGMKKPDADAYLSSLWASLVNTEQWEALVMALHEIEDSAKAHLLAPKTDPHARAHAAGQVVATQSLLGFAKAATTFDPRSAAYEPSDLALDDEVPPDADPFI